MWSSKSADSTLSYFQCICATSIQMTVHCVIISHCVCNQIEHRSLTLGEVLDGDRMAVAMYNVSFKETFERKVLCTTSLNSQELEQLQEAIEDLYYFEFVYGKWEREREWVILFHLDVCPLNMNCTCTHVHLIWTVYTLKWWLTTIWVLKWWRLCSRQLHFIKKLILPTFWLDAVVFLRASYPLRKW